MLTYPVQEPQLSFYGDAMVEAWRGTQHGSGCPRCQGAVEVFDTHFGQKYNSHAWGLAGKALQTHQICPMLLQQNLAFTTYCSHAKYSQCVIPDACFPSQSTCDYVHQLVSSLACKESNVIASTPPYQHHPMVWLPTPLFSPCCARLAKLSCLIPHRLRFDYLVQVMLHNI